jgi:hypothetical protein
LKQSEIVGLVETWVEERSWEKIEKYKRECQGEKRGKKKGKDVGE